MVRSHECSFLSRARRLLLAGSLCLILAALVASGVARPESVHAEEIPAGRGNYTTTLPAGAQGPSDDAGNPAIPKKTGNVTGAIPTNDWSSSLVWHYYPGNPYSENMYPHPLALHARAGGLGVSYPTTASIAGEGREYLHPYTEELTVGVAGLNAPATRLDDHSDWAVTAHWSGNGRTMRATFGHGLPFVYVTKSGDDALVSFNGTPSIWYNSNGVVGATINGHHYGIFGPSGASWSGSSTLRSSLAGKDYFSVAALPDNSTTTLEFFRQHAYAFVTDTRVTWSYDEASASLTTTFSATTELKENLNGNHNHTLLALYRHQWLNSSTPLTGHQYVSPRGIMKVREGNSFSTVQRFNGVLPALPDMGTYDRSRLYSYVDEIYRSSDLFQGASDTYWTGKALGRIAALVRIAEQVGHNAARDHFLGALKGKLEDWLTASDGRNLFYYDNTWGTLIGYPASYGSDTQLNDHHFHYGYYIMAAATIAQYDPAWASDSNWGGMVKLLIKDAANWDSGDARFPRLRNFDPYAGHGWASGPAFFAAGNNQESSSESINFSTAVILWGAATGDQTIRDLGIFLYTNEVAAIEQYWFDVDNAVFPSTYNHEVLGILWGQGGAYGTWWTANPEEIHGINFLPITAGSLYLGRRPDYLQRNYNELVANNGGQEQEWRDIIWNMQALYDPAAAVAKFDADPNYAPEAGETKAHTYHWLHNLNRMGRLDTSVTANIPTYAVFNKDGTRTYVAYNPGSNGRTVQFSDGKSLTVPARALVAGTGESTDPTPTPPPDEGTPVGNTLYAIDGASLGTPGTLAFSAGSGASTDTIPSAGGANYDGTPHDPLVYVVEGVSGSYDPNQSTRFSLYLDAYANVADGSQARISYDLDGNGSYDRVETYNYFATNAQPDWESYTEVRGLKSASGTLGNLNNGRIRLEIWNAIGTHTVDLRTSATGSQGQQSLLRIPFTNVTVGGGTGWQSQDVGAVGISGNTGYDSGTFTVDASGADIWNNSDEFRFVYQTLEGDGEIVARVTAVENTDPWAKAGVMIRETLSGNSTHAMMVLTPGNGLAFQYRTSTGGSSSHTSGGSASAPNWVKVVRQGNTLTGYASTDGTTWRQIGSTTITMAQSVYVGLAVTAHNDTTLCTARFDQVSAR